MSTVLWANLLVAGVVETDAEDRAALFTHGDKLDALCTSLGLPSFLGICDDTDARFNIDDVDLPEGMESTDQLMAVEGVWLNLTEAIRMLETLLNHIKEKSLRFGLLKNQHEDVVQELADVLAFAKAGIGKADRFNFSVVM